VDAEQDLCAFESTGKIGGWRRLEEGGKAHYVESGVKAWEV